MLTPNEYDHLTDQLIHLYWDLDEAIIADITRRLMKTGGDYLPNSAKAQAERLQQAGLLYEDIIAEIAKRTEMTQRQVAKTFERAGVQSIRNDNRSYQAAGMEGIVKMSDAALQTLNAGYQKCAGELQNLTLTTANTAQAAYLTACDRAYMQVSTGAMDYQTAIRRAIQGAAEEGAFVLYPSGHRDRLDVAVRRSVLTGVGQTVRKLSEINAGDMGCDLMEITAHAGARPDHAEWQGMLVSLSGKNAGRVIDGVRVLSLKEIGYGTGEGFGGWNCRHDWYPYFEGISHRAYTDARLKALNEPHIDLGDGKLYTDYEVSQMQRELEREVRAAKRQVAAANAAVESAPDDAAKKAARADFTVQSVRLKAAEKELHDFCGQTGFREDSSRVWVNGFGRSTSQKAVWANKKAQKNAVNWLTSVGNNGKIDLGVFSSALANGQVNTTIEQKQQRKHQSTPDWRNQVKQAMQSGGKQTPKSRLFKAVDPQKIVDQYGGTGTLRSAKNNQCVDEYVTLPFEAGVTFDRNQGKYVKTHRVQIKYTKDGVHVFPVTESGRKQ